MPMSNPLDAWCRARGRYVQAAISLENTRLYRNLAEREARIRRLLEADIVGIIIWDLDANILNANEAFLRMVGRERQDFVSGRLHWTDLTPVKWHDRHRQQIVAQVKSTGSVQPFEWQLFHKDGSSSRRMGAACPC
jgi:PAS domain S-box-containing protein